MRLLSAGASFVMKNHTFVIFPGIALCSATYNLNGCNMHITSFIAARKKLYCKPFLDSLTAEIKVLIMPGGTFTVTILIFIKQNCRNSVDW
jgi:hypothetical protein